MEYGRKHTTRVLPSFEKAHIVVGEYSLSLCLTYGVAYMLQVLASRECLNEPEADECSEYEEKHLMSKVSEDPI